MTFTTAPTSLAASAYSQLKQQLDNFHFVPGDRFSESEVSALLGMSRTPIREALVRLQREGYISVMPKLGWLVNPIDFHVFAQLYDVRCVLECAAIGLLGAAPDLAQRLAPLRALWCVPEALRLNECSAVSHMDESFHMALVQASGNHEMARIHRDLTERIRTVRRLEFTRNDRIDAAYDEHAHILETLLAGDTARTQALVRQHIAVSRDEVKQITLHTLQTARRQRPAHA